VDLVEQPGDPLNLIDHDSLVLRMGRHLMTQERLILAAPKLGW
jgi:hypothetical protein